MTAGKTKYCPFCGTIVGEDFKYCNSCGKELPIIHESPSDATLIHISHALALKYEVLSEIGRGGMAIVYKATQKNLGRIVALKVLPEQFTHDSEFVARFHREAHEAAKLDHPNIVAIHDEGVEGGVHFIAMQFLEGKDLHSAIKKRGAFPYGNVVPLLTPVAEALDYAHSMGVVHRDVKSSNIMLTRTGRAVLMDFGIAHAMDGTKLTRTGAAIGTPEYMSPEQAEGKDIDGRSDIYSLGVVLYEALAGKVPFTTGNPISTIHRVIHELPNQVAELNPDIPDWLDEIVMTCLEKNPDDRFSSGSDLAEALRGESLAETKRESATITMSRGTTESNLHFVLGLLIAFLMAAIIIGIFIESGR